MCNELRYVVTRILEGKIVFLNTKHEDWFTEYCDAQKFRHYNNARSHSLLFEGTVCILFPNGDLTTTNDNQFDVDSDPIDEY